MLWSQHLRRWEGRWAEKEGVSGPDGSEEGKWGEVVRTQETRKARMIRKGTKSRKCRKDEKSKRKRHFIFYTELLILPFCLHPLLRFKILY